MKGKIMYVVRIALKAAAILLLLGESSMLQGAAVRVIIENRASVNGTWLTSFWMGFHVGTFDIYDQSAPASTELERMAEDGNAQPLMDSFDMTGAGTTQGLIASNTPPPPFAPSESAEITFLLESTNPANRYFSFISMVIPSNDAFIGNDSPTAHQIFDGSGNFSGAYVAIYGTSMMDAGTEVNDEIPANTAFFGQTVPNTGVDENGVVHTHPGYLPPESGGILDDPFFANADFTQPGYEVARITIIRVDVVVTPGDVSGVNVGGAIYCQQSCRSRTNSLGRWNPPL
jgi:hypothetical protein